MKHKILHLTVLLFTLNCFSVLGQLPTPNNDVFVTNEVSINTDQLEFSPTFYEDGILFISTNPVNKRYKVKDTRIDQNIMSIFRSTRDDDGKLEKPKPFALELLTTVHEGPLTFDRTADNIFFTRNNYKGKKRIKGSDGIVKLQIYTSERMDNVWKNVEKLSFNDKNSNAAHPSISVENDQLYFASDRPGGQGGMDLYVSLKTGDTWGEPINLGPKINTPDDEVFPFIHADGTLYFSSTGHGSIGGLDIYTAQKTGAEWSIPENMGSPFNSSKDDFGIIIDRDKRNGYFSSSRNGGIGQDDIYSFFALNGLEKNKVEEIPDIEKTLTLNVIDEETGAIVEEAIVTYMKLDARTLGNAISDLSNAESNLVVKLPIDENARTGLTDFNGQMPLRLNRGNYVVKVEKEGFISKQLAINSASDILEYTIALPKFIGQEVVDNSGSGSDNGNGSGSNPIEGNFGSGFGSGTGIEVSSVIEEGTVIELPNIYYNFNDADIRPDARVDLESVAEFLLRYPEVEIELSSHTDSRGSDRYNNRLSQRRAEEAVAYLTKKGISASRMVPKGYGESSLRNHCDDFAKCSETEHQYNRRTEVKITRMDQPISVKFINNAPSVISEAPEKIQDGRRRRPSGGSDSGSVSDEGSYNPEGSYKVIAGAFSNMNNAEKRLLKIRDLGYQNADILKFGNQGLFHVVVSSYSTSQEASSTVRKLKRKNVRAFIKN